MKRVFIFSGIAVAALSQAVSFSDTEFVITDYTITSVTSGDMALVFDQWAGGGNPGNAYRTTSTAGPGASSYQIAAMNSSFTYDPSVQGAIASVDFSIELLRTPAPGTVANVNMPVNMLLTAMQDGNMFVLSSNFYGIAPPAGTYAPYSGSGAEANFFGFELGTGASGNTIDFSSSGSVITFGFFAGGGLPKQRECGFGDL